MSNEKTLINGFIVIRKPQFNLMMMDESEIVKPLTVNGKDIYYGGIDRAQWYDFTIPFYSQTLEPEIRDLYKSVEDNDRDYRVLELEKDLGTAIKLLNFANSLRVRNELIAIYSESLVYYKGEQMVDQKLIEWKGYDIKSLGHWSLLEAGLFNSPSHFAKWLPHLNEHGLFSTGDIFEEYVREYIALSAIDEHIAEALNAQKGKGGHRGEALVRVGTVIV